MTHLQLQTESDGRARDEENTRLTVTFGSFNQDTLVCALNEVADIDVDVQNDVFIQESYGCVVTKEHVYGKDLDLQWYPEFLHQVAVWRGEQTAGQLASDVLGNLRPGLNNYEVQQYLSLLPGELRQQVDVLHHSTPAGKEDTDGNATTTSDRTETLADTQLEFSETDGTEIEQSTAHSVDFETAMYMRSQTDLPDNVLVVEVVDYEPDEAYEEVTLSLLFDDGRTGSVTGVVGATTEECGTREYPFADLCSLFYNDGEVVDLEHVERLQGAITFVKESDGSLVHLDRETRDELHSTLISDGDGTTDDDDASLTDGLLRLLVGCLLWLNLVVALLGVFGVL